ncbi:hexosaminidase [Kribbella sp. VKM Ac-2569]|uniref:beta-N-acetylhexosaminidase n=1 Tax=Kribbella sp. VKM Ac-2569 TaxID=2512220 RepID=UPI0010DB25F4|nr:family 20 glycosylhydrolase [Kribbella sp. VKM Ac-2569]RZT19693.1 hexosaminidase [Kribbella sp. VKM Ac-2569]
MIPAPAQLTSTDGTFTLTASSGVAAPPELAGPVARFVEDLQLDCGLALAGDSGITVELGAVDDVPPAAGVRADGSPVDERHGVEVTAEGVRIWGPTPEAVHRGLTSLRQLISAHLQDGTAVLPATRIVDGPRFAWRGLSLDVVRTFHAPAEVRRIIDMLALYKLNVLHLHLTDDQGWRVEVPSRPALTEVGAIGAIGDRPGGFYSLAELAELVAYAADRYVTVVPEIDMPGHTAAVFKAYPELGPAEVQTIEVGNGDKLHLGTLDPGRDETWVFVEDVLDAVIPQFPRSAYVHIGGDETWGMADEDHAAFVEKAAALVRERGKKVVGWQEIARAKLDSEDVVQYWLDLDIDKMGENPNAPTPPEELLPVLVEALRKAKYDAPKALEQGTKLIVSPVTWLYFDRPHADMSADPEQEKARERLGLEFYGAVSIEHGISWDPADIVDPDQIAGVEAAIWCETITSSDDLELLLLPRIPGLAEKAWSHQTATNWPEYAARLGQQSPTWRNRQWTWLQSTEVDWN